MEAGQHIGRYVVERVLGQGAVGVVYEALDPLIGRKVALKTLRTDMEQSHAAEFAERFLREARAAGRLSHPNITTVYDAGTDAASGEVFIAMEYVEGHTLEAVTGGSSPLDVPRALELVATLAQALDYAHGEGVVHRDVKPANIMMSTAGVLKITDFGIARLDASTLTVDGAVLGTPYYMAPEQVAGQVVDGRTDLYALGVILFELLSGTRPFSGRSMVTMLRAIISEAPPDLTALRSGISAGLAAVVQKALAKNPAARYQSGRELAAALHAELELAPPPAVAPAEDLTGATVMGVALPTMAEIAATLHFDGSERVVHLRAKRELVIGREPASDIHLTAQQVSRRHATITLSEDGVHFTDLASSNGSSCNGAPVVAPRLLRDGDVLGIGGVLHFLVRLRRTSSPPFSVALIEGHSEYLLCPGEVLLGCDPSLVDLRLGGHQVAPVHARIGAGVGAPVIRSEGSHAQLRVNGSAVDRAYLVDQTLLEIGGIRLLWVEGSENRGATGPTRF